VIDGAEEYRAEPSSGRNAGDQTNIFPVDGDRRSKLKSWRAKDRLQVAICEPVEVDNDGDIFGRQRINGTDRIFVRIASFSIQTSLACIARLEPSLDWTVI